MNDSRQPFRVQFPLVRLPERYGGRQAIVVMTMAKVNEPNVGFATCIDSAGKIHQNVPMPMTEVKAAALRPVTLVEVEGVNAPPVLVAP